MKTESGTNQDHNKHSDCSLKMPGCTEMSFYSHIYSVLFLKMRMKTTDFFLHADDSIGEKLSLMSLVQTPA